MQQMRMIEGQERKDAKAAKKWARTRAAKYESRQRYLAVEKEVKCCCRRDKQAWVSSLAYEGETVATTVDIRLLYNISRRLSGARMNPGMPMKEATGQLLTDPTDQLKRWFEHFEQLFQVSTPDQSSTSRHEPPRVGRITRVNFEAPSLLEIEAAIRSMKSNKATGVEINEVNK